MRTPIALPQFPQLTTCTSCELHTRARNVGIATHYLPGSLAPSRDTPAVVLLGQNPGVQEDRTGVPFIGPSGQLVQDVYLAGIKLPSLATVYLTNTARCYHRDGDGPSAKHYKACRTHLLSDLKLLEGEHSRLYVLCLGAPATLNMHALCGIPKVSLAVAFSTQMRPHITTAGTPVTLMATYHPAAILRTRNLIHAVAGHMQLLLNELTGAAPTPTHPHIVPPFLPGVSHGEPQRATQDRPSSLHPAT